jgi:hypothetical protein
MIYNKEEKCEYCRQKNSINIKIYRQSPCVLSWTSGVVSSIDFCES